MNNSNDTANNSSRNTEWKRTYWIVFLTGVAYVLLLGLFTYFFNNPI